MQIQAAIAKRPGADFEIEPLELSAPQHDEILVRIAAVGLCHTDLGVRDNPVGLALPAVLGHEGAGVVEAVGDSVVKVAPGDRVLISFRSCGVCPMCERGQPAYCRQLIAMNFGGARLDGGSSFVGGGTASNFFGQSSFATHALTYERNLVKLPQDVPFSLAAPLACGVQTGAGSILRALDCRPGAAVAIIGGGTVGLSAVMAAKVRGCHPVILIEPMETRRALALQLGATHAIDPFAGEIAPMMRAIAPAGVDYVLEASGAAAAAQAAFGYMGTRGVLGLVGVPPSGSQLHLPLDLAITFGFSVRGVIEGDSDPQSFIPELLALHRSGRLPFDRLITTFPFAQINAAVAEQKAGRVVKVVLLLDEAPAARPNLEMETA
jgi:aryl-alcohol dehydrogenase